MSPDPSPLVIGPMALPSAVAADCLGFLLKSPAACNSAGANRPPLAAPSNDKKERRLQPNFRFITNSLVTLRRLGVCSRPLRFRQFQSGNHRESIRAPYKRERAPCPG